MNKIRIMDMEHVTNSTDGFQSRIVLYDSWEAYMIHVRAGTTIPADAEIISVEESQFPQKCIIQYVWQRTEDIIHEWTRMATVIPERVDTSEEEEEENGRS